MLIQEKLREFLARIERGDASFKRKEERIALANTLVYFSLSETSC